MKQKSRLLSNNGVGEKRNIITTVFLAVYTVIQIYPLFWLVMFSLKNNDQIYSKSAFSFPLPIQWSNYLKVFKNLEIGKYLFNSLFVTVITITVTILFSCMASYASTRLGWKHGNKAIVYFTLGIMIPVHTALLPMFIVYKNMGLLNTRLALIIIYSAFLLPQAVFIISGFIRGIPKELDEAAYIDGCNPYRLFFSIHLPLLLPVIATVSIFSYLFCWNELMLSMTYISRTSLRTLAVGIMSYQSDYFINWGIIGAAMVIALLPTLIIYFALSEQIQKSLMAGAVKG